MSTTTPADRRELRAESVRLLRRALASYRNSVAREGEIREENRGAKAPNEQHEEWCYGQRLAQSMRVLDCMAAFHHEPREAMHAYGDDVSSVESHRPVAIVCEGHVTTIHVPDFEHIDARHVLNLDSEEFRALADDGAMPVNPCETVGPWDELELKREGAAHPSVSPHLGDLRLLALLWGPGTYAVTRDLDGPEGTDAIIKDTVKEFTITEAMTRDARRTIHALFARTIGPLPEYTAEG